MFNGRKETFIEINPANMKEGEPELLTKFLATRSDTLFLTNKRYQYLNFNILFSYPFIKRPCNPIGKQKDEYRYEIISLNRLAKGVFGEIYIIDGTLVPPKTNNELLFFKTKPRKKQRVVKIIENKKTGNIEKKSEIKFKREIYREYLLTSPKLHMKMPVFDKNKAILVMRRLFKENLLDFFIQEYPRLKTLECLKLGLALLKAGKTDLKDRKIVHRDLKPENIMVSYDHQSFDDGYNNWEIVIIDYGLAKFIDKNDICHRMGNLLYMSPECYERSGTHFYSDMYSFGCLLSEVFGCNRSKSIKTENAIQHEFISEINLDDLFSNMGLKQDHTDLLRNLILYTTKPEPLFRATIEKSIEVLEKLIAQHEQVLKNINNNSNNTNTVTAYNHKF